MELMGPSSGITSVVITISHLPRHSPPPDTECQCREPLVLESCGRIGRTLGPGGAGVKETELARVARMRHLAEWGTARLIRRRGRTSQREMAEVLEVSASALSRWERGHRSPSPEVALRWLSALEQLEQPIAQITYEGSPS